MYEHPRTRGLAELLMDLEGETDLRLAVMDALKATVPPASRE